MCILQYLCSPLCWLLHGIVPSVLILSLILFHGKSLSAVYKDDRGSGAKPKSALQSRIQPDRHFTPGLGKLPEKKKVSLYLKMENYVNDLKHPINPVFDWDLWENELISAVNLVPVLRLASMMLESPASQRFIYSLINTDSHHRMSVETGRFNCHFRKSTAPDDVVQARFKLAS